MSGKSPHHNVYWYKRTRRWLVKIHARGNPSGKETLDIGYYLDEETAARVADVADLLVRGPEAKVNFNGEAPPGVPRATILARLLKLGLRPEHLFLGNRTPHP